MNDKTMNDLIIADKRKRIRELEARIVELEAALKLAQGKVAAEREACAALVEAGVWIERPDGRPTRIVGGLPQLAAAIRARGKK